MKAIGVLGGTFDPIHFGHLRTALEIHDGLQLAEVRLIPCNQPVHRQRPAASSTDRLAMVTCAIADEPALSVDDCEILRPGPSWTIDTLETLRERLPDSPLCLIMGIDVLLSLPRWRRFKDILSLAHIVVAHRPGYRLPQYNDAENSEISELLKQHRTESATLLHTERAGAVLFHPVTPLEISATDIRRQCADGGNPRWLLPDTVCAYIRKNGIYKTFDGNPE